MPETRQALTREGPVFILAYHRGQASTTAQVEGQGTSEEEQEQQQATEGYTTRHQSSAAGGKAEQDAVLSAPLRGASSVTAGITADKGLGGSRSLTGQVPRSGVTRPSSRRTQLQERVLDIPFARPSSGSSPPQTKIHQQKLHHCSTPTDNSQPPSTVKTKCVKDQEQLLKAKQAAQRQASSCLTQLCAVCSVSTVTRQCHTRSSWHSSASMASIC